MSSPGRPQTPDDVEGPDPSQARERTKLAWTRSSIAVAAMGAALLRHQPVLGAPLLILSAVIWSLGLVRRRPGRAGLAPKRVAFVAICITVIGVAALVIALAGPSSPGLRL